MMPTLSLTVVAKNHEELAAFSLEHVRDSVDELVLLSNPDARFGGYGAIGNHALTTSRCDIVGLVHADVTLGPGALESFAREAATGAIAGMVGITRDGEYVWCRAVQEPRTVSTLDSCSCFVKRDTLVRFDEKTFDSFHCCVEDFCLTAAAAGLPTRVPPAPGCDHLGTNWPKPDWMADYSMYRRRLMEKWIGRDFRTT